MPEAMKVLTWNKWVLEFLGIWPSNESLFTFSFFFFLVSMATCFVYADLIYRISDFKYVVENLTENIVLTLLCCKIGLYRLNRRLMKEILLDIKMDYAIELYNTEEQKSIFLAYNRLSKSFIKYSVTTTTVATVLYYIQPLMDHANSHRKLTENSSITYILPYHMRMSFNITESSLYYYVYAYEGVLVPIIACGYSGTDCLLVTLTLHLCAQISVLANQVENFNGDFRKFHSHLKQVVTKHSRIISLSVKLRTAFAYFLLVQLVGATLVVCLAIYNLLKNYATGHTAQLFGFIFYGSSVTVQLLGYSFIGERLMTESLKLSDAFYNCKWYVLSPIYVNLVLFCILRAQVPLVLTAAGFCTFSLQSFTDVVKTSMTYLSVLRHFV
nr:odorant receptor 3 [Cephus cinctus]